MSAAIRAQHTGSRCSICRDVIRKGDPIVCLDDAWLHADCEPHFAPWDDTPTATPPAVHELIKLLNDHGTLGALLFKVEYDPFQLPKALNEAVFEMLAAEGKLWSLLRDLSSEHAVVD